MSEHFIDPTMRERDCDHCGGSGGLEGEWVCGPCKGTCKVVEKDCVGCNGTGHHVPGQDWDCTACCGSGRIIVPDAKPEIEIDEFNMNGVSIGFFWQSGDSGLMGNPTTHFGDCVTAFETSDLALAAARAALQATAEDT